MAIIETDQLKDAEWAENFVSNLSSDCRKNLIKALSKNEQSKLMSESTKKILQHILWDNWTEIFGSGNNRNRKVKLTAKDYIICLEIVWEAKGIPHGFNSLLFRLFYEGGIHDGGEKNLVLQQMWNSKLRKRTAPCVQKIMKKMDLELKNPYPNSTVHNSNNPKKYKKFEDTLTILRKQKNDIDYADYKKVKEYYEKYSKLRNECEIESCIRFDMEN